MPVPKEWLDKAVRTVRALEEIHGKHESITSSVSSVIVDWPDTNMTIFGVELAIEKLVVPAGHRWDRRVAVEYADALRAALEEERET